MRTRLLRLLAVIRHAAILIVDDSRKRLFDEKIA